MTMITRRRALQTGAAAAAVATLPGLAEAQGAPVVKLRVLETTDLHVNVFPYDYYRDAADDTVGLGAHRRPLSGRRARRRRTACCSTTAISSRARPWATSSPIGAA